MVVTVGVTLGVTILLKVVLGVKLGVIVTVGVTLGVAEGDGQIPLNVNFIYIDEDPEIDQSVSEIGQ